MVLSNVVSSVIRSDLGQTSDNVHVPQHVPQSTILVLSPQPFPPVVTLPLPRHTRTFLHLGPDKERKLIVGQLGNLQSCWLLAASFGMHILIRNWHNDRPPDVSEKSLTSYWSSSTFGMVIQEILKQKESKVIFFFLDAMITGFNFKSK